MSTTEIMNRRLTRLRKSEFVARALTHKIKLELSFQMKPYRAFCVVSLFVCFPTRLILFITFPSFSFFVRFANIRLDQ